ncbi:uncharacterized protein Z519_00757 [Cladophialophora bantiana CBS 173.52]|uniref:Uncharacterized protein n=1 Tax=Cladophialophora bantiana (strain ATCC 10958 / CBS 173.52 / CDC B-1940 / NIH 8579) TaxID=1442370 RepID=A0A0D2IQU8_CLAB1|nr:uncharacterized protein Z519_00757 [Cladophialophora bantiana CBS 173.52]KIW99094.1 hypothetical protein Z519_00757 [Cladophialophora bantiana CBS 173.52]
MIGTLFVQGGAKRFAKVDKANSATSYMFSDLEAWEDEELWPGSEADRQGDLEKRAGTMPGAPSAQRYPFPARLRWIWLRYAMYDIHHSIV